VIVWMSSHLSLRADSPLPPFFESTIYCWGLACLERKGILIVFSTGNGGPTPCSISNIYILYMLAALAVVRTLKRPSCEPQFIIQVAASNGIWDPNFFFYQEGVFLP